MVNSSGSGFRAVLKQDLDANAGAPKSRLIMRSLRVTHRLNSSRNPLLVPFAKVSRVVYRLAIDWVLGVEIPWTTSIGPGLQIFHGHGIVVNAHTVIGSNVQIRQHVTLGARRSDDDCPVIEDDVVIGVGAIIIGSVTIGRGATIGAGAVVLTDVPAGAVAVGNPARVLVAG